MFHYVNTAVKLNGYLVFFKLKPTYSRILRSNYKAIKFVIIIDNIYP